MPPSRCFVVWNQRRAPLPLGRLPLRSPRTGGPMRRYAVTRRMPISRNRFRVVERGGRGRVPVVIFRALSCRCSTALLDVSLDGVVQRGAEPSCELGFVLSRRDAAGSAFPPRRGAGERRAAARGAAGRRRGTGKCSETGARPTRRGGVTGLMCRGHGSRLLGEGRRGGRLERLVVQVFLTRATWYCALPRPGAVLPSRRTESLACLHGFLYAPVCRSGSSSLL